MAISIVLAAPWEANISKKKHVKLYKYEAQSSNIQQASFRCYFYAVESRCEESNNIRFGLGEDVSQPMFKTNFQNIVGGIFFIMEHKIS